MMTFVFASCLTSLLATVFPGENAVWSPKGDEVAMEIDVGGDQPRIAVFDASTAQKKFLLCEDGACHPAWRSDGEAVVFTRRYWRQGTAKEANLTDEGWNLCIWERNKGCRRLTKGRVHDAMPSFSPDGKFVYFVSTRESLAESATFIFRIPSDGTGAIERLGHASVSKCSWTGQPVLSPDGRCMVWARFSSLMDIWHLRAAKVDDTDDSMVVSEPMESAYEPRFSPDGRYLAYTGFRLGDDGWGVYLQDFVTGATRRVAKGRFCDFRPDGKALLVSQNGETRVRVLTPEDFPTEADVVRRSYPSEKIVWAAENLPGRVQITPDERFTFGQDEVVFARARVKVPPADRPEYTVFRGGYGSTTYAFQLWFGKDFLELALHDEANRYVYARGRRPETGKVVEIVAVRTPIYILLYVDGREIAHTVQSSGVYPLQKPFGFFAAEDFGPGEVEKVEFGRGWPTGTPPRRTRQEVLR